MLDRHDDLINDILVDSDLAKLIVPNKFKHTSKQGRARRQKLLMGAKKLSESKRIQDITLAEVCEEAGIPRASAYHFFPNVESIFLALRFLNYMETYNTLEKMDITPYKRWQDALAAVLRQSVVLFNSDVTKNKLMYGSNTPDFDGDEYGGKVDRQMAALIVRKFSAKFSMTRFHYIEDQFLITYHISHSIFALSFRQYGRITEDMLEEATKAAIAYLRCYLPENLPRK